MTTYPHNAKLYRTTPDYTIAKFTYKRQSAEGKHILEDSNRVTVTATDQQLSSYTMSRRRVLTELEEVLRQKIDRVHEELREAGIDFNPVQAFNIIISPSNNPIVEVHKYDAKSGRYIESYPSASYASRVISGKDTSGGNITAVCRGRRLSAFGFKWSYEKRKFFPLY